MIEMKRQTFNNPFHDFLSREITWPASIFMSSDGLIWLDGSDVVYSNWLSEPRLETGCGHINTHSGFHWKISSNCSQEYYFICEFGEFYAFFLFYKIFI